MESNTQTVTYQEQKGDKALNIAYVSLVVSLIALGLSGYMLYKMQSSEGTEPKTMEKKIDKFFEKQDQELDKMFDEKEEGQ